MALPKPNTPPRGLTPAFIDALRAAEDRYEVADRRAPGLRLRVLPGGRKVFRWYCTSRAKVITIGTWTLGEQAGHVTLAQAREWLERLKRAHDAGTLEAVQADLATFLQERPHVADPTPADGSTFGALAEEFYDDDITANRKRPEDARAILDNDLLPALAARPLAAITTRDVREVVKRTIARGAAAHAGKVLALAKQFWTWAQANDLTDENPAASLRRRYLGIRESRRKRFLSAAEIPIFWRALDRAVTADRPAAQKIRPATATALKILLLTAVRTGELLKARWTELDLDAGTWTIPIANQKLTREQEKDAEPFTIALPPTARALFDTLHGQANGSPWVLPGRGKRNGHESKAGHLDDKTLGHAIRRLQEGDDPILVLPGGPVAPHDLRRTARTHLGKLRIPYWIVERVLNHSKGKIVKTYDQNDYLDERRDALERWDAYVLRLVAPEQTNVIPLASGGTP